MMPTSIGDVIRADVDGTEPGVVPVEDPPGSRPTGASTARPPPAPVATGPGGAAPGSGGDVAACGADRPSTDCTPACARRVDVSTVVPHPASTKLPATASAATVRTRSGTPVTRPTVGTSDRSGDVASDESRPPTSSR